MVRVEAERDVRREHLVMMNVQDTVIVIDPSKCWK